MGLWCYSAWGQEAKVPRLIRFSGVVRQTGEKPVRGAAELHFALFKEESGGEPLWFESQTVEVDAQGRYQVLLGAMHPDGLPMDLFTSGEARWLSIMVGKQEQPRVLLVSVPYALKAADAESLGGKPASAYVASEELKTALSDPKYAQRALNATVLASTGGGTAPSFTDTNPSTLTCNVATNCLVITQNSGAHALLSQMLATSGAFYGVYGLSASTTGRGVFGQATATTGANYGVRGLTASTSGYGVYGAASATTGVNFGVAGTSASTSGRGIFGDASATTGSTFGLFGQAASVSGVGLQGSATAVTGVTTGVRAISFSPSGTGAVIDNLGGGKLISARTTSFVEKFSVDGSGNVAAAGLIDAASASFVGAVAGGSFTGSTFAGDGSGLTSVNADLLDGMDSTAFAPASSSAAYVDVLGDVMVGQLVLPANGLAAGGSQLVLSAGRVGVGILSPLAQLHVDTTDATDGAGASAVDALTVAGGEGGDQNTGSATAGAGSSVTITGGSGGAGLGTDSNGGNGGSITLQPGAGGAGDGFSGSAGNVLLAPSGTGSVGIGTSSPGQKLEINGGLRLNTLTLKPACSVLTRGTFWITLGGAGVEDLVEVCTKDAADAYDWRNVI
jgi:hypothetical protein